MIVRYDRPSPWVSFSNVYTIRNICADFAGVAGKTVREPTLPMRTTYGRGNIHNNKPSLFLISFVRDLVFQFVADRIPEKFQQLFRRFATMFRTVD